MLQPGLRIKIFFSLYCAPFEYKKISGYIERPYNAPCFFSNNISVKVAEALTGSSGFKSVLYLNKINCEPAFGYEK